MNKTLATLVDHLPANQIVLTFKKKKMNVKRAVYRPTKANIQGDIHTKRGFST